MSRVEAADDKLAARETLWRRHQATWTLIGLLLGALLGLAIGELAAPLRYVGDAFVNLLQMTVLPYVIVALMANFGRLSAVESRRLVWVGGCVLILLWAIGLYTVFFIPHAFPDWKSGSFFSS
ncbi:MAG: cation:dicarboxylase symporter family transporter, partial [Planctomycetales bacterium]|nr:cation:dicarboxylase symporter family transporter [Planctomycetales bacterium]